MKTPWSIIVIRICSILTVMGSVCLFFYSFWVVGNIPESEIWFILREDFMNSIADQNGHYTKRAVGAFAYGLALSSFTSFLILIFSFKRMLVGIRIVLGVSMFLAVSKGSIPLLSAILFGLTFTASAKAFCKKSKSNQTSDLTSETAPNSHLQ